MTQVFLECTCPPGHAANTGQHHPECSHRNIDAQVSCSCCPEDHDHGAAANACPGNHESTACPEPPGGCRVWKGAVADAHHPLYEGGHPLLPGHQRGEPVPHCPGGHCHKDIPDCGVCRPLVVTVMPGTQITMAGAS